MSAAADLRGLWTGVFGYSNLVATDNGFVCTMSDDGGTLSGSISEPDEGAPGGRASALLTGRRTKRRVSFAKTYDGGSSVGHRLRYDGILSGDGLMIEGRWSVGAWSGAFVMQRPSAVGLEEEVSDVLEDRRALESVR